VVKKFPLRIKAMQVDNGHEFQAKFHWHITKDIGMEHDYKLHRPHSAHAGKMPYEMLESKLNL
jgi:hypothetical protein